jgi:capsular polysaccharide biosynthesis protein
VTLRDYFRMVRSRWKIILTGVLVGLVTAIAVTVLVPREYAAKVTIYVSAEVGADSVGAYQGNLLSAQKVKSYAQLLPSNRIAEDVIGELELDMAPDDLAQRISASSHPDTVLLTITATDRTPQRAMHIADATADAFIRLVAQLETPVGELPAAVTASIVEPASLPNAPVRPRPMVNIGLGLLLGLMTGFGAALLRSARDTAVKSAGELVQLTGAPNLGMTVRDQEVPNRPLIAHDRPSSPAAEAFARSARISSSSISTGDGSRSWLPARRQGRASRPSRATLRSCSGRRDATWSWSKATFVGRVLPSISPWSALSASRAC